MQEFEIRLYSVQDVQDFVALATTQPFPITIRDAHNKISADSFMELFCLDFTRPLIAIAECTDAEFYRLRDAASRFMVR